MMKKYITETRVVEENCNKCGIGHTSENYNIDMHRFEINFGYASNRDGEEWNFDLCSSCIEKMVTSFIHVPDKYKDVI